MSLKISDYTTSYSGAYVNTDNIVTKEQKNNVAKDDLPQKLAVSENSTETSVDLKTQTSKKNIDASVEELLKKKKQEDKSTLKKFLSKIKSLYSTETTFTHDGSLDNNLTTPETDKEILKIYTMAVRTLESHGIDFDELTETQQKEYLIAIANYKFKNIKYEDVVKTRTKIQKEIINREKLSGINKLLPSFIKKYYDKLFNRMGDFSNATTEIVLEFTPESQKEEVLNKHVSTIEKNRMELAETALTGYDEELKKDVVKIIAKSSENISTKELNKTKQIIKKSNLSQEAKNKLLQKIEEERKQQELNTNIVITTYYIFIKDKNFNKVMEKINKNKTTYEKENDIKSRISKKTYDINEKKIKHEKEKNLIDFKLRALKNNLKTPKDMETYLKLTEKQKKLNKLINESKTEMRNLRTMKEDNYNNRISLIYNSQEIINSTPSQIYLSQPYVRDIKIIVG